MTRHRHSRGPKRVHLVYLSETTIPIVTACGRQVLKRGQLNTDDLAQATCNQCTATAMATLANSKRDTWAMENYHYRRTAKRVNQ